MDKCKSEYKQKKQHAETLTLTESLKKRNERQQEVQTTRDTHKTSKGRMPHRTTKPGPKTVTMIVTVTGVKPGNR